MVENSFFRQINEPMGIAEFLECVVAGFRRDFTGVTLLAEIESMTRATSGHLYLTLKDTRLEATLSACLFRSSQARLTFAPKQGDLVQVKGDLSVYAPRGQMNFVIRAMEPAGEGALYAKFIALKEKLLAEGLFEAERKKPIPVRAMRVGIVTSREAAALRDVVTTLHSKAPAVKIILYPSAVQGDGAEDEVIKALTLADQRQEVDVLLLVRGGGSLTDLWTFNGEKLARCIASMQLPVVCGVGHETDVTIADLVSDYRAATPTAAAEKIAQGWQEAQKSLSVAERDLDRLIRERLLRVRLRCDRVASIPKRLKDIIEMKAERFDALFERLRGGPRHVLNEQIRRFDRVRFLLKSNAPAVSAARESLIYKEETLHRIVAERMAAARQTLSSLEKQLNALDFKRVLDRGYSITRDENGAILRDLKALGVGSRVETILAEGSFVSRVERKDAKK